MSPPPAESRPTEATLLADRLRLAIVQGQIPPGSRLKLVPLARRFEVSRGPLREAASRLAAEGLIEIKDQRGFWVAPISGADLADVTRTRQRVESMVLADSIAAGDLAWEAQVMAALHVLNRTPHTGHGPAARARFRQAHAAFHEALGSACPSAYLLGFRDRLFRLSERYRNLLLAAPTPAHAPARDVQAEHRAIAEAAVGRRTEDATALLVEHLQHTARALAAAFPELLFPDSTP